MLVDGGGKVPLYLVDPNGSREESVIGMVEALSQLHLASLQVFSALRDKIDEQRKSLSSLTVRIESAAQQVETLKGPHKRALRILSPAKYPPKHDEALLTLQDVLVKKKKTGETNISRSQVPGKEAYLVPGGRKTGEGKLGKPPPLKTADSFLIFNAQDNPYKGKREDGGPKRVEEKEVLVTEEPLSTPADEDDNDDFYYNPSTSSYVPQIDVPDTLPSLPGIVDFHDGSLFYATESPRVISEVSAPPPVPSSSKAAVASAAESVETLRPSRSDSSSEAPSVVAPPPPPPPPPPPVLSDTPVAEAVERKDAAVKKEAGKKGGGGGGSGDMRSNLMEAIRAAGGKAALRSGSKKEKRAAAAKEEKGGPDLMADLKHSLAMRRKGISGQGDLMQRLASVIPQVEEEDNDDDEEEDDWDE